ncbi:CinA family protein [Bacillus tuaregi]|uniref:CinA family protein n=1 Tax=Bacillus tuaregi TaxID=1816695 RepID=UPI0008F8D152|nr:CinA family protein [Bacillus tuaregi]
MNLEEKLVDLLIRRGYHISFAESCTGGLMCAQIVNVPNASRVLNSSFITYSNEAKTKLVYVNPITLEKYGAVSEEVAREMASGAAKAANSEVGVGITGVAGPSGGTEDKPVGMVCFGFNINGEIDSFTQYFEGLNRNEVRRSSVNFVLEKLLDLI